MGDTRTRKAASGTAPVPESKGTAGRPQQASPASSGKVPRTARGERTLRKILDAALEEFGEKGFSEGSIVGITGRAEVALGTFYTYFDSKDAVFQALVRDMSERVRLLVAPALSGAADAIDGERLALAELLRLIQNHKPVYRIIDEAEFVYPEGYRRHYEGAAERIAGRLRAAVKTGEVRPEASKFEEEVRAWAIMGANVFVGLRFGVWETADPDRVAEVVNNLLRRGLQP